MAWWFRGFATQPDYHTLLDGVTLGVHEMGHAFFMWFGNRTLTAAGGTLFQLAVPLGAAIYLYLKQNDLFGAVSCPWSPPSARWTWTATTGLSSS